MQIQPPRRRAAQAAAILVIAAGVLVVLASLAPVFGLVLINPSLRWGELVVLLTVALVAAAVTFSGRKLLRWGSGD